MRTRLAASQRTGRIHGAGRDCPCPLNLIEPVGAPARTDLPSRFLTVRMHDLSLEPSLTAVCAGYEGGQRRRQLMPRRHLLNWVPDFALRYSERTGFPTGTCMEIIRRARPPAFGTKLAGQGGVPGEILLYIVCRQVFGSDTVVNKVFFKTGVNDEVRDLTLFRLWIPRTAWSSRWARPSSTPAATTPSAMPSASVREHLQTDYLKSEFGLITPKIDDAWPYARQVRQLIDGNMSLDQVFSGDHPGPAGVRKPGRTGASRDCASSAPRSRRRCGTAGLGSPASTRPDRCPCGSGDSSPLWSPSRRSSASWTGGCRDGADRSRDPGPYHRAAGGIGEARLPRCPASRR